ncbi:MAG: TonB-dependent receptor [Bacteroidales bacterium]|nr:TonB-dependent receptor [Bacteroidales bacterium]
MYKTYLLLFVTFFVFATALTAQEASVRGFVYEEESGEPAIFCNVFLKGTTHGASTDVNGYFLITKVPAGNYTLMVTYIGFDTIQKAITLQPDGIFSNKLFLAKSSVELETVTVNAARTTARTETRTSVIQVSTKEIRQIPSIGGQADFAQYLQVVPGVVFTGDQGGQFYVRGGTPIQNKVILDGMTIYNPFHSIGLFSIFETDLIRNAEVYTGGFNAEYGGRISSVMDISYKDGNKKRVSGSVGASTFGARAVLEVPIVRQKSPDKGSSSFILSFKNSYLSESSKMFYEYVDQDGLPFNFMDIYGKVSINAANGSKVSFFGFNFTDDVTNYKAISDFGWNSFGGGLNFVVIPGRSPVLIEGLFAYSKYETGVNSVSLNNLSSSIGGFTGKIDFSYFFGKNKLQYGVEIEGFRTEYSLTNYSSRKVNLTENTTQLGIYAKYKLVVGKFIFEPGFRAQWYASLAEFSPEPRIAIKYNTSEHFRLKLAAGMYSQNLIAATSGRDVVNLFYGFLSGPENLPKTFNGEPLTTRLQKSNHIILGAEIDLGHFINLNVEGYYKKFPQLTSLNHNNTYSGAETNNDFIIEQGNAYGLDVSMKYDYKKVYLWLVYSLGFVNREYENTDGQLLSYTPHFDRRHNVNVVFSYITGPKKQWEFSARWNFGSGFPFTQVQGFYEYLTFPGGVNTDYLSENGDLGVIYAELFGGRLPTYHRLDVDVKRNFYFSARTKLVVDLSVTNLYNRDNVFYVDLVTSEIVYQLPLMPSLGLNLYF